MEGAPRTVNHLSIGSIGPNETKHENKVMFWQVDLMLIRIGVSPSDETHICKVDCGPRSGAKARGQSWCTPPGPTTIIPSIRVHPRVLNRSERTSQLP
jgi:hypothetical protein